MSTTNGLPEDFSGIAEFKTITTDLITGKETVSIYTKHYRNGELHREDGPAVLLDGNHMNTGPMVANILRKSTATS